MFSRSLAAFIAGISYFRLWRTASEKSSLRKMLVPLKFLALSRTVILSLNLRERATWARHRFSRPMGVAPPQSFYDLSAAFRLYFFKLSSQTPSGSLVETSVCHPQQCYSSWIVPLESLFSELTVIMIYRQCWCHLSWTYVFCYLAAFSWHPPLPGITANCSEDLGPLWSDIHLSL